eukprot:257554-Rhodomonas_salina.1
MDVTATYELSSGVEGGREEGREGRREGGSSTIRLRARYALSGTAPAYRATLRPASLRCRVASSLLSYAFAGTDAASMVHNRYAMSGTDCVSCYAPARPCP